MLYFAVASEENKTDLFKGHEYEMSPGGYLCTKDVEDPMEAAIFMMGLLLEIANAGHAFNGVVVLYQSDMENPEAEEYKAFRVSLSSTSQAEFHANQPI